MDLITWVQTNITELGTLIGIVAGLFAIVAGIWKAAQYILTIYKNKNSELIELDYWRLFGPSVPRLMELIECRPSLIERTDYHARIALSSGITLVEQKMWRSYLALTFNRTLSVGKRLLWDRYSGNKDEGCRLDFLAKPAEDSEIVEWIDQNYIDESGDIKTPEVERWRRESTHQNDLGFLFLAVKNVSGRTLNKVQFSFLRSDLRDRVPAMKDPGQESFEYEDIKAKFVNKGDPSSYLVVDPIEMTERESYTVPHFRAGEEFVFLLSVYRADESGFENGYLDDVFRLSAISTNTLFGKKLLNVREPEREKALREKIPYGWFRQ